MRFSSEEVKLAEQLHKLGLPWEPKPGHFVWDTATVLEHDSPFHDRVFFILDLKHFLRRTSSIENLKKLFYWLPTWHDAREVLEALEVGSSEIAERLKREDSVRNGTERLLLYQMIEEALMAKGT